MTGEQPETLQQLIRTLLTEFNLSSEIDNGVVSKDPYVWVPWDDSSHGRVAARQAAERLTEAGHLVLGVQQHPETLAWGVAVGLHPLSPVDLPITLTGLGVSKGAYVGAIRVLLHWKDICTLERGEVLCCPTTDPNWAEAFERAGAVITATGSLLCHAAIVCREYGLPCVVNVRGALRSQYNGLQGRVDGKAGTVEVLAP